MLCKFAKKTSFGDYDYTCLATDEICKNYLIDKCLVRDALYRVGDEIDKNYKKGFNEGYKKGIEDSFEKYTQRLTELIKDK